MYLEDLGVGTIIRSKRWKEPVEIKKVEKLGDHIHIIGSTTITYSHIDQLIPIDDISEMNIEKIESDFSSPSNKVFLAFESKRFKYASIYDPLLAINVSKVDPLPHQIEAVYGHILKLPRIRFLIADDPGAGKTIMAGLIIKELKLRNLVKRVMIVTPGHLKDQWRRELKERFEETFTVVDRGILDSHYGENIWDRENQIITSIDFAKRDEILPSISATHFDLIVVDEAHKMSAYKYGNKIEKKERYKLGEVLSRISDNLLFLTATPHRGDPENFRLFLDLIEPGFFATSEMLEESIRNKDNPLFIRRLKEDMKDFEGRPLIPPRAPPKTVKFMLSEKEKILYNEVSKYVKEQYNKALMKDKKRNVAFALVILQRRLASSAYALLNSLERRKAKLEDLMEKSDIKMKEDVSKFDLEEAEDMSEEDRWEEEEIWETLSMAENKDELRQEIETLKYLIKKNREIVDSESEVKVRELKGALEELNKKFPGKKVIIFTESRDTLDYLEGKVKLWGYTVNVIHGGMKLDQRVEAEKIFKNQTQILIATEAAGEGINLQFCNLMINYDIPWNPNRLEQRMGRIHRYGQQYEVVVLNLVAKDTREGEVLSRMFEKLEEIRRSLGNKVFDVIGEVFLGKNLQQIMIEAASGARSMSELLKEIDIHVDEKYIREVKENLAESLATKYIDYTRIKEMAEKAREYKLIPEYTEEFFRKAFALVDGRMRNRKDGFITIDSVPYEIKSISEEDFFRRKFGTLLKSYPKISFDKELAFKAGDAELVSFGHPLFEAVLEYTGITYGNDLRKGAVFIDPEAKLDGHILFYEGEITDGLNKVVGKKLFTILVNDSGARPLPQTVLWDLAEGTRDKENADIKSLEQKSIGTVISSMERYKKEKAEERERDAAIKEKYGIRSLEYFAVKLDGELIELYRRKEDGENVDLVCRNKEDQKKKYDKALVDLKDEIIRERALTMGMPRCIGIVRVKPSENVSKEMKTDPEIEKMAMVISMKHEEEQGRTPEDVSSENLGFDIRSTDNSGIIRYIEVKGRAELSGVALTKNEWFKAKRFGDSYYLYAVLNVSRRPEMHAIQNPAEKLSPEEMFEVRYFIPFKQLKDGAENG